MKFTRTKSESKTQKIWFDETGNYRVSWRSEVAGCTVQPAFYAVVRCRQFTGDDMWDFAGRRGPYKTFKKATDECEKHQRVWTKFLKIMDGPYPGRAAKLADLDHLIMSSMPWWVLEQGDEKVCKYLLKDDLCRSSKDQDEESIPQNDPSPTLKTSAKTSAVKSEPKPSSPKTTTVGLASVVTDQAEPSVTRGRSQGTVEKSDRPKRAKSATAPNSEPKPSVKPATKRKSKPTKTAPLSIAV